MFLFRDKNIYKLHQYLFYLRQMQHEKHEVRTPGWRRYIDAVQLSTEQKNRIDRLFLKGLGKKIPYDWHRFYTGFTGSFDEAYFPDLFFRSVYVLHANHLWLDRAYSDKDMLHAAAAHAPGVREPFTFASCFENGVYREDNVRLIDRARFLERCANVGPCIIKPTMASGGGRNVRELCLKNGIDQKSGESLERICSHYGTNYTIQEKIVQHPQLAVLHPDSVNTIRITTYLKDGKLCHFPLVLRIGVHHSVVDNGSGGGICAAVLDGGQLAPEARRIDGETYTIHPDTGIVFKDTRIDGLEKIRDAAYALHSQIPRMGIVSWDFTLDSEGRPTVLELNLRYQSIHIIQRAHGVGGFGENTEWALNYVRRFL